MLSIIIPAYNEENKIVLTLEKFKKEISSSDEIIVVTEGSDKTAEICRKKGVRVLEFENRLGKGGSVKEGVKAAKGEIIVLCDADYGFQEHASLKKLLAGFEQVSTTTRYSSIKIKGNIKRKIVSRGLNLLVRILFGLNLSDTQCGFKAFKSDIIKEIMPAVKTNGFAFDIELLWLAKKKGYSIKEVPMRWDYIEETTVNVYKTSIEIFKDIIKIRFGI